MNAAPVYQSFLHFTLCNSIRKFAVDSKFNIFEPNIKDIELVETFLAVHQQAGESYDVCSSHCLIGGGENVG